MNGFLSRIAAIAMVMIVVAPSNSQSQGLPQPWSFAKQALDQNGQPLLGPVTAGQIVTYVLSYQPNSSLSGPITITDTLSPGQTYVLGSIAASPGWTWNTPPYNVGNQQSYFNAGIGPGNSFVVTVPVGGAGASSTVAGDGTLPIPVGNRVYGIYHHASRYFGAKTPSAIYCWDLATLSTCSLSPGAGPWPRSTDSYTVGTGPSLATPGAVQHAVIGTKIYFAAAVVVGTPPNLTSASVTTAGIACWDTTTEAPCSFIPLLPGGPNWTGIIPLATGTPLNHLIAGVATDSTHTKLFMYAADSATFPGSGPASGKIYCMTPSGLPCTGWTPPSLSASPIFPSGANYLMLEESASPTGLYANIDGKLSCVSTTTGLACGSWSNNIPAMTPNQAWALSPRLNAAGSTMTEICLHSTYAPYNAAPVCLNALSGASQPVSWPPQFAVSTDFLLVAPFHIPGTSRILYPFYPSGISACLDFSNSGGNFSCFTPPYSQGWSPSLFQNYGYAVDPANPQRCLLGLGDEGYVWRFGRDGGYASGPAPRNCTEVVEQTFDINSAFCAIKPTSASWQSITIVGAPPQLTSGSFTLLVGGSPIGPPFPSTGATTNFSPAISAIGAGSQLTVQFTPTYSATPTQSYQLQLNYSANVDPQICYKATVGCGPVTNQATMMGAPNGPGTATVTASAQVNLGSSAGPQCSPNGLLKICKIAGPGIPVGQAFTFTAGGMNVSVPAGPPPGGLCAIGPSLPVGSAVTVAENVPNGIQVSNIDVQPPTQLVGPPDIANGTVNLTVGTGVTETTFTNTLRGYLEICKAGTAGGNYSFTVNPGNQGPFTVPNGACSPPIQVPAGQVVIHEAPHPGTAMSGCSSFPATQQGPCNLSAQTSTVTVAPGGINTQTVATITNRCLDSKLCPPPDRQATKLRSTARQVAGRISERGR